MPIRYTSRMSGRLLSQVLFFLLLVLIALAGGAFLAWPVHLLLPDIPFSSLAERGSLLCGLVISLLYVRWTMRLTAAAVGFSRPDGSWLPAVGRGYGAGLIIMLVLALCLWILGLRVVDEQQAFTPAAFAIALLKGLVAGIGASLIEETIFRGALFSGLQQRINTVWAILLTSLLYAAVHFIAYPEPAGSVHWHTGLALFPAALTGLTDPAILDHFLTLFLLGVLLAMLRWRDGNIWRAFGLHAGVVMIIKLDSYVTDSTTDTGLAYLVSDHDSRLGWLSAGWLLILIIFYAFYCYRTPGRRTAPA